MRIYLIFKYFFHAFIKKQLHVVFNIKMHNKMLIILSVFLMLMFFTGCVSAASSENVTLTQNIDDVVNEKNTDEILTVEGSLAGTNDVSGLKELEYENKLVAFGKNNEILGAVYDEASSDSASSVLGSGEYSVGISFNTVSYNEYETLFSTNIKGPENPDGRLELFVDGNSVVTVDIDGNSQTFSCAPVDAGSHTWSAEFRSNGGGTQVVEADRLQ